MAMVIDPITGALVDEKELKKNKKAPINITDIEEGETFTTPDAEEDNEVSGATAFVAGLASGVIKAGEGVVSLGCLLYTSPSPRDGLLSRMPSSA